MLATPVIVVYTFVPASHWNDIEWNPIDSDAVIFVNRSPDWPSPYYGILDTPTSLVDRTADPKLGHTYTVCATLGTETRCSESKYIGPSPVSAPDKPPPPKITKTNVTGDSIEIVWQASQVFASYNVIWGFDGAPEQPQVPIQSRGTEGSFKATQLLAGARYYFRVQGCVGGLVGCSDFSLDRHVQTTPTPPAVPVISANVQSLHTVQINWTGVPGATKSKLYRFRQGNPVAEQEFDGPFASGTATDQYVAPGRYYYTIQSLGNGISASSSTGEIDILYLEPVPYPGNFAALPFWPISSSSWAADRLDLVYAGPGNDIYRQAWDVDHWLPGNTSWQWLGNWTTGTPVEVATPPIGGSVFVLGKDMMIYTKAVVGGYAPQDWEPLGGPAAASPAAISATPGRLDVFIAGADHQIYHKTHINGNWQPSQSDWTPLGSYSIYPPVVISSGPNRIDLFIAGADQAVYQKTWDGSQWLPAPGGWKRLNGTIIGSPSAVSWAPGRIDLLVRGTDSTVYQKTWDNGQWLPSEDGWQLLGGTVLGPPALVSWGPGRLDIFIVGTDKNVYHKDWDGTQWLPSQTGWEAVGGTVYSDPLNVSMPSVVS